MNPDPTSWRSQFSVRELQEIDFCRVYADEFNHGTDGHLVRGLVAKMARLLDVTDTDGPSPEDLT